MSALRRIWPHVVAAFVVFHVAASCLDVIPDVSLGMNRKAWKEPRVRFELDRWSKRLGVPRADLEDELFALGNDVLDVRQVTGKPFRPYMQLTGQRQAWAMFIAGTRFRERFQVRAKPCALADSSCAWEVLYGRGDDEHRFLADILEHSRVRSAVFKWGWPQAGKAYERGCRAIARRVFEERSDLAVVQCRFERSLSPPGDAPDDFDAKPEWGREQNILRDAVTP